MGWFTKLLVIGVVGYGGFYIYKLNDKGYLSLPDIPAGAYPISFDSGLRGIVYDMDVTDDQYADAPKMFRRLVMANRDRRFIGLPSDVPSWFEDTWSTCSAGTEEERESIVSEPRRVCRRLIDVSYAAMASVSRAA